MTNERDKVIQELLDIIQKKKEKIAKAERPNWLTNCAFRYNKDTPSSINVQVCSDVEELVNMTAFLIDKRESFDKAQEILGTKIKFKWLGFSFDEWLNDISTRINKIQIVKEKKELEEYEATLEAKLSPSLKEEKEIAEIKRKLTEGL